MIYFRYGFLMNEVKIKAKIKRTGEERQMASKGQKFKKVSLEKRLTAVKAKLEQGKSYIFLGQMYGVSWQTVASWVKIYKRDGGLDISKRGRRKNEENIDYKERYEILKKFQDYLEEVDQEKK